MQAALHAAKQEIPVLYIGLELGELDIIARLTGLSHDIYWSKIYRGDYNEADTDKLKASLPGQGMLRFHFVTGGAYGWSYDKFKPLIKAMHETYKNGFLVVLDYLQIIASPVGKNEDLRHRIQQASYAAHDAALKYDASVLMLSSTARENYSKLSGQHCPDFNKNNAYFHVGLGKESGEIEYAATGVILMAKESSEEDSPNSTKVHFGIAKNRMGRAGAWIPLEFDGSRFEPGQQGTRVS